MASLEFIVGQLDQAVRDFRAEAKGVRQDIQGLRKDIDEIKLFRAKVLGASLIVSILASSLFAVSLEVIKSWGK